MKLADLDPKFLAWLRANRYVNGMGPRSVVVDGKRYVIPWSLPTPGLTPVFEQHDVDYLFGGTNEDDNPLMNDRRNADYDMRDGVLDVADRSWWLRAWAVRRLADPCFNVVRATGKAHFRHHAGGPRTQAELMAELYYTP